MIELVDLPALLGFYRIWSGRLAGIYGWAARADFLAALAALIGVLVFDTLPGLFIGIAVSMLLLLYRPSLPHVAVLARGPGDTWLDIERHPDLSPDDDVRVVRVESGLYFANADHVRDALRREARHGARAIVLDAETAPSIDVTATQMLAQAAHDLAARGVRLAIAHPIGQTRDVLRAAAATHDTEIRVYATVDAAVTALR